MEICDLAKALDAFYEIGKERKECNALVQCFGIKYADAAELLTCIVYQPYMPTEIQPRYKTPTFDPFCSPPARHSYPSFSFSTVSLFMDNENGTFYQKCALWIAISQNRPKYFHK